MLNAYVSTTQRCAVSLHTDSFVILIIITMVIVILMSAIVLKIFFFINNAGQLIDHALILKIFPFLMLSVLSFTVILDVVLLNVVAPN